MIHILITTALIIHLTKFLDCLWTRGAQSFRSHRLQSHRGSWPVRAYCTIVIWFLTTMIIMTTTINSYLGGDFTKDENRTDPGKASDLRVRAKFLIFVRSPMTILGCRNKKCEWWPLRKPDFNYGNGPNSPTINYNSLGQDGKKERTLQHSGRQ